MKLLLTILFQFSFCVLLAQPAVYKKSEKIGKYGPVELQRSVNSDTFYYLIFKNQSYSEIVDLSFGSFSRELISDLSLGIDSLLLNKDIIIQLKNGYHLSWYENGKKILLFDNKHKSTSLRIKDLTELNYKLKTLSTK